MIAKATVFLTADRTQAVSEGSPDAKVKLVHAGQEISQAEAERYPGALELIGGTKEAAALAPKIKTRVVAPKHRDPRHMGSPKRKGGFPKAQG